MPAHVGRIDRGGVEDEQFWPRRLSSGGRVAREQHRRRGQAGERARFTLPALVVGLHPLPARGRVAKERPAAVGRGRAVGHPLQGRHEHVVAQPDHHGAAVAPHRNGTIVGVGSGEDDALVFRRQFDFRRRPAAGGRPGRDRNHDRHDTVSPLPHGKTHGRLLGRGAESTRENDRGRTTRETPGSPHIMMPAGPCREKSKSSRAGGKAAALGSVRPHETTEPAATTRCNWLQHPLPGSGCRWVKGFSVDGYGCGAAPTEPRSSW